MQKLEIDCGAGVTSMLNQVSDILGAKGFEESVEQLLQFCVFLFTHAPDFMNLDRSLNIVTNLLRGKLKYPEYGTFYRTVLKNMLYEEETSIDKFHPVRFKIGKSCISCEAHQGFHHTFHMLF